MFARMRLLIASTAAAVILHTGCQAPDGPQPGGVQQQKPAGARQPAATDPSIDGIPTKIQAKTYLAAARLHESQNRPIQALQQYQYALNEDPQNVQILVRIGVLNDQIGNGAAAEAAYREALRFEPDNAQVHNNLGFSYILRQRWQDAEAALTRAVELAPGFARARINLGLVLAQTNRFDEAFEQFQAVLPPADAYYNLGLMYQSKRKNVDAAAAYKRALEANPKLVAATEQLKKMPADVLDAADRKIREEREAAGRMAMTSPEERIELAGAPATRPAGPPGPDWASVPGRLNDWFHVVARNVMIDASDFLATARAAWSELDANEGMGGPPLTAAGRFEAGRPEVKWPQAEWSSDYASLWTQEAFVFPDRRFIRTAAPATQPASASAEIRLRSIEGSAFAGLDALLPPWQRSPEVLDDLSYDPLVPNLASGSDEWLDHQASPPAESVPAAEAADLPHPVAESAEPN
ncbi:MAG TPA: tetratricopeptide repeat protein [Phycisphaerae bacterium]|nr:tetratricopeptide repeat protein [Phycisphaerae bacterium]